MADANIFQQYLRPAKTMQEYSADMDKADANALGLQNQRGANALQALTQRTTQQGFDDDQAVRQATIASGGDQNALLKALRGGGQWKAAQAAEEFQLNKRKTEAVIGKDIGAGLESTQKAATGKADAGYKAHDQSLQRLQGITTPEEFTQWAKEGVNSGGLDFGRASGVIARLQADPSQFEAIKAQMLAAGVSVADTYKVTNENTHVAATNATSVSNNTATNLQSGLNNTANNLQSGVNNDRTNSTSRANAAGVQAGENTRAGLLRSNQLTIAGLDPQGNILGGGAQGGGLDGIVKGIGTGQVPLATALARMPAGIKAQVLAKVAEQYPEYDATDMAQRSRAAVAFGTGPQGNSVRSFNVSLSHLDTLGNLSDALNNGNMQLVNKIGNIYTQQTGSPAPTNFEAAKKIVTDEIVKAIVGTGGGVHDREAAAETIGKASSPAQLAGVIKTYKELMVGQLGGLERQYQATTGRSDFKTKFLSPEAKAVQSGGAPDIHSAADAILRGK